MLENKTKCIVSIKLCLENQPTDVKKKKRINPWNL